MRLPSLFVVICVVGVGCGSGTDEAPEGDGKRETGLPHAELVRRADAICNQARQDIRAQVPSGELGTLGVLAAASVSDKVAPRYVRKLERLRPRVAETKRWRTYLGAEQRLVRLNRAAISASQSKEELLNALAKARGPSTESERAATALGFKACTRGPNTHVDTSAPRTAAGDTLDENETSLPRTGVRARIPKGWRPKRSKESGTTAFASDDDDLYCAFGRSRFGAKPGDGSPRALLKYAKSQSDFVKGRSRSYRLISIQRERAANDTGVGISREADGRAEHITFFYQPPQRYIVLCATRTPGDFAKRDRQIFRPVIHGLSLPGKG